MNTVDPRAAMKLQPKLSFGETIYCASMPNANTVFHSEDWFLVPFSFLCGGFAIFWEAGVLRFWETKANITRPPRSWFSGAFLLW